MKGYQKGTKPIRLATEMFRLNNDSTSTVGDITDMKLDLTRCVAGTKMQIEFENECGMNTSQVTHLWQV